MTASPLRLGLEHGYRRLPERFYARVAPTPVAEPRLVAFNGPLARELGLDAAAVEAAAAEIFSGNALPEDAEPIALAYAGHQFGHFTPQLGDGRAILIGEVTDRAGRRRDIQLKGSGPTPFSRRGDGRAALGPVLREYLVSEAMHALGAPTTRALAAVTTGEPVYREEILPGAVLARVASSHIRVGTFEYFAVRGDAEGLKALLDHAIARHDPAAAEAERPAVAFLAGVITRQARLIARWMGLGFIHGVMNTDNMTVSGETIDYGPCAFMDAYDAATVYSAIDRTGRYAYGNQPRIAHWNLVKLAEAMLPLIDAEQERAIALAVEALDAFPGLYETAWLEGMRAKLGLGAAEAEDRALAVALLAAMADQGADFTLTFRALADAAEGREGALRPLFAAPAGIGDWLGGWRARLAREGGDPAARAAAIRRASPAIVPRNHRVEQAIRAATGEADFAPFHALSAALAAPYEERPETAAYMLPPAPDERVTQTFCGT